MDNAFWLDRWQHGETGWHLPHVHPKLKNFWPIIPVAPSATVFVPLCGKSQDMLWLAKQQQAVIACELSELAVQQFFAEAELHPVVESVHGFKKYSAQNITIYVGDFFALDASFLTTASAIYDRAALIALPPEMRSRYVAKLRSLMPQADVLLLTLSYDQSLMSGPPFAVTEDEVTSLYAKNCAITRLASHSILDKEPRFVARGLNALHELVFRLSWTNV